MNTSHGTALKKLGEDLSEILPRPIRPSFLWAISHLADSRISSNIAIAVVIVASAWIVARLGPKRADEAIKNAEMVTAKVAKIAEANRIIPENVQAHALLFMAFMVSVMVICAGWNLYLQSNAVYGGFSIIRPPGGAQYFGVYSPGSAPKINGEGWGWYSVTPDVSAKEPPPSTPSPSPILSLPPAPPPKASPSRATSPEPLPSPSSVMF